MLTIALFFLFKIQTILLLELLLSAKVQVSILLSKQAKVQLGPNNTAYFWLSLCDWSLLEVCMKSIESPLTTGCPITQSILYPIQRSIKPWWYWQPWLQEGNFGLAALGTKMDRFLVALIKAMMKIGVVTFLAVHSLFMMPSYVTQPVKSKQSWLNSLISSPYLRFRKYINTDDGMSSTHWGKMAVKVLALFLFCAFVQAHNEADVLTSGSYLTSSTKMAGWFGAKQVDRFKFEFEKTWTWTWKRKRLMMTRILVFGWTMSVK